MTTSNILTVQVPCDISIDDEGHLTLTVPREVELEFTVFDPDTGPTDAEADLYHRIAAALALHDFRVDFVQVAVR
jgi:hypothetical protein